MWLYLKSVTTRSKFSLAQHANNWTRFSSYSFILCLFHTEQDEARPRFTVQAAFADISTALCSPEWIDQGRQVQTYIPGCPVHLLLTVGLLTYLRSDYLNVSHTYMASHLSCTTAPGK
jgi:hypothetical protein